jgi:hypothetical protein
VVAAGLSKVVLKNLGFLGFFKKPKKPKVSHLGFLGFLKTALHHDKDSFFT